jgi:gliding motility-associated-like protein
MKSRILIIFFLFFIGNITGKTTNKEPNREIFAFEKNNGQLINLNNDSVNTEIQYFARLKNSKIFLTKNGYIHQFERTFTKNPNFNNLCKTQKEDNYLETYSVEYSFNGTNPNIVVKAEKKSEYQNHYLGKTDIISSFYEKITYVNAYNNIDWIIYFIEGEIKYDFIIKPGGNVDDIEIKIRNSKGISINPKGDLIVSTPLGNIIDKAPISFQKQECITTQYQIFDSIVKFKVSNYNKSDTLTIDPFRVWSMYVYGSNTSASEDLHSSVRDSKNNIYLVGGTYSSAGIATINSLIQTFKGKRDGMVLKFDNSGNKIWGTYIGGTKDDIVREIIIDAYENIIISGITESSDLESYMRYGHQKKIGGGQDFFIFSLDKNDNSVNWGTYYGGTNDEYFGGLTIDKSNNILLTGNTWSTNNISTPGTYQTQKNSIGYHDAFIAKFDNSGIRKWATYFGGDGEDYGGGITTDNNKNIFISGTTGSSKYIAYNSKYKQTISGSSDIFLSKFDSSGNIKWATYIGGDSIENSPKIKSFNDAIYVTAVTNSLNGITTSSSYQINNGGKYDAFVMKLDNSGKYLWSSYLGGKEIEYCWDLDIDSNGNCYVVGVTESTTGISYANVDYPKKINTNWPSGYLISIDSLGQKNYGTYYGGDYGANINSVYFKLEQLDLCGHTRSCNNISTTNNCNKSGYNGFFVLLKANIKRYDTLRVQCCEPYIWNINKTKYTISGTYTCKTQKKNIYGGDSIIVLILKIFNPIIISNTLSRNVSCFSKKDGQISNQITGGNGQYKFQWNDPQKQNTQNAYNLDTGTFKLFVSDNVGCRDSIIKKITQPSKIITEIIRIDSSSCFQKSNGNIYTQTHGGSGYYQYSWSDAKQQKTKNCINVLAGKYILTIFDSLNNSCFDTISANVAEPTKLSINIVSVDSVSCHGYSDGRITITANGGQNGYEYYWNTSPIQITNYAANLKAGNYIINVTDFKKCSVNKSITVYEPEKIIARISKPDVIIDELENSINCTVTPPDNYNFNWGPKSLFNSTNQKQQIVYLKQNDTISVIVTSSKGCKGSDTAIIKSTKSIFQVIPTAFSPNDDQLNETFGVPNNMFLEKLRVYNKTGTIMFESSNNIQRWDGKSNNQYCESAFYLYELSVRGLNCTTTKTIKGTIFLRK